VLLVNFLRPRLNLVRLEVRGDILHIHAGPGPAPDAREVGLAVRGFRCGRGQIRLAVGSPRDPWGLVIEPQPLSGETV
jgi:hypothetical protein